MIVVESGDCEAGFEESMSISLYCARQVAEGTGLEEI